MEVEGVAPNSMVGEGPPSIVPTVVPTTIVREVLTESNYAYWSTCVQWYLEGQGLWEVCEMSYIIPDQERDPVACSVWKKKNAMALHAIQISCSRQMFTLIRDKIRANAAWDFLKRISASTGNADLSQYDELLNALLSGSSNNIEQYHAVSAKNSETGLTPLHIAVLLGNEEVVEKLVNERPEDLEQQEARHGYTPLASAAVDGTTKMAKCMIRSNTKLTSILDWDNTLPVVLACIRGKKEMTSFLYNKTPQEELDGENGATLLSYCIAFKFFDIALDIFNKYPRLAVTSGQNGFTPLYVLGQMPSLFKSGSQLWFWQRWIYKCMLVRVDHASDRVQVNVSDDISHSRDVKSNIGKVLGQLHGLVSYPLKLLGIKNIYDQKLRDAQAIELFRSIRTKLKNMNVDDLRSLVYEAVIQAVEQGNVEFATKLITYIPERLVWNVDTHMRNIFFIAILNRQEKIFNLLHGLDDLKKKKMIYPMDRFGNNMLHLVAKLAPSDQLDGIPGAALQIQRELQWFKEVESIVPTFFQDLVNKDGLKPNQVFSQQHADLVEKGEKWMKEIATSSSFVAALIVTIMFAAAFTIPGGNNDKGAPIFLQVNLFMVFIISDSISLFSATTSVLMFLRLLTSQYAEIKFLTRLPTKLIIGLSTLFVSIAAMMIAFCAALAILLKEISTKVVMIPIILLACVPVTQFALLQFPLLFSIAISTYGPSIFNRNIKRWY